MDQVYTLRLGHYGSGIHNEAGTLWVRYTQRLGHYGSGIEDEAGTQWSGIYDEAGTLWVRYTQRLGHYGSGIHATTPALIIRSWEIQPRSSQQNGSLHGSCQRLVADRLCWRRPEASLRTVFVDISLVCSLLLP